MSPRGEACHRMYGLVVCAPVALPSPRTVAAAARRRVTLDFGTRAEVEARLSAATADGGRLRLGDGGCVELTLGAEHDLLLRHDDQAVFHVAAGGDLVGIAPSRLSPASQRVLLDTVLGTTALVNGLEGLHAAAVELRDEIVVAITAPTGGGKSTLCAELVQRGARLFSDDLVFMERLGDGALLAHPGPTLMNVPAASSAPLGKELALFADERWVRVEAGQPDAAPLAAIVVLDRREGAGPTRLEPRVAPRELLGALLDSGPFGERPRRRFELLADLVAQTPVLRLTAAPHVPASDLARFVEAAVP